METFHPNHRKHPSPTPPVRNTNQRFLALVEPNRLPYSPTTQELQNAAHNLTLDLVRRYRDPLIARLVVLLAEAEIDRSMTTNG